MIQLFRVFIPTSIVGVLLSEVLLVSGIYTLAVTLLVESGLWLFLNDANGWARLSIVLVSIMLGLHFNDFYARLRIPSVVLLVQQVCLTIGIAFLVQAFIAYFSEEWRMPRRVMLSASMACIFILPAWRILYGQFVLRVFGAERLLFVGSSQVLARIARHLAEHSELGMRAAGVVTDSPDAVCSAVLPHVGPVSKLPEIVRQIQPARLIAGLDLDREKHLIPLIHPQHHGVRVEDVASLYETVLGRICLERVKAEEVYLSDGLAPDRQNLLLHAAFSFLVAVVALILLAPIMVLVALAVRLSSPGPALFRQTRVGLNNKVFTLFKFRSMYVDAEASTGAVWAQENDPRVTPVGRWIRLLRFDELPQLFNVLRGEMSVVGPRPERPEFVKPLAEKIPLYMQRHCVRPGITGWAQINYRYGNTLEDTVIKLEYDIYYVKRMSLSLDFFIMFQTVKTMLLTRGAY